MESTISTMMMAKMKLKDEPPSSRRGASAT
jgi:hypothetical protein